MSVSPGGDQSGAKSIVQGMALLACGRPEGLTRFRGTVDSVLSSLAPGVAIHLVALLLVALHKNPVIEIINVELSFCGFLALPVFSQFFARRWGREELWLRYATAASWCEWVHVLVLVVAVLITGLLFPAFLHNSGFIKALAVSAGLYGFWLGAFVIRTGLRLGWGRAILLYGLMALFGVGCDVVASFLPPYHAFWAEIFQSPLSAG